MVLSPSRILSAFLLTGAAFVAQATDLRALAQAAGLDGAPLVPDPVQAVAERQDPGLRLEPLAGGDGVAESRDSDSGRDARFANLTSAAWAARIPLEDGSELLDQWLVPDGRALRMVSVGGAVATFALVDPVEGVSQLPNFTQVAVRPGDGLVDRPWDCFLWDDQWQCVWRTGSDGALSVHAGVPFAGGRSEDGPGAAATFLRHVEGLVAGRDGTLYLAEWDSDQPARIRRIAADGTVSTLAGGLERVREPRDGRGRSAGLVQPRGLALDEEGGLLYVLDGRPNRRGEGCIRGIALKDGTVETLLPDPAGLGSHAVGLAFHQGRLLVGCRQPPALFVVDPGTGRHTQVFEDAGGETLRGGPCLGSAPASREACAALGAGFAGFASGQDDRICVLSGHRLGLLRLDLAGLAQAAAEEALESE